MKGVDYQEFNGIGFRTDADWNRTDADWNRTDADKNRMDAEVMIQINVNNLFISGSNLEGYNNGPFIPVFQDMLKEISCDTTMKPGTVRVLLYLISRVDEKNNICAQMQDIIKDLKCSSDTVSRAIQQLITMRILCKRNDCGCRTPKYEFTDKIINPRLAAKGNMRRLKKSGLPNILNASGVRYLLHEGTIPINDNF